MKKRTIRCKCPKCSGTYTIEQIEGGDMSNKYVGTEPWYRFCDLKAGAKGRIVRGCKQASIQKTAQRANYGTGRINTGSFT